MCVLAVKYVTSHQFSIALKFDKNFKIMQQQKI